MAMAEKCISPYSMVLHSDFQPPPHPAERSVLNSHGLWHLYLGGMGIQDPIFLLRLSIQN